MTNKNTHHDGDAAGNFAEQENIPIASPDSEQKWEHRFIDGPDTSWHPGRLTNLDMSVKLVYEERLVPSPDSVRDMGENMLNPSLSGTFTELCNLDPAAKAIKMHLENGADLHFLLISVVEHYAPIALKYDPATAARLEEVTRENERLKLFIKNESARLVESVTEVERYREALQLIRESAAYKVLLHEGFTSTTKLIDSLSRGATEQSTEQGRASSKEEQP